MGISGLLPALKSIQVTRHISEYSGKTVAVDAYVWLHRGVYSCATELATGQATTKYVDYAMHRVRMLQHFKITPYIVFDGGPLPAKKGTESDRKARRDENLARGKAFIAQGKTSQARECFIKCVDVTPEMAYQLIKALRAESVSYVVAPYEADAQLAYLEMAGFVDAILTEDSDLLVFGCKHVLFKFDVVNATVVSISRKDFGSVCATSGDANGISLIGWSDVQFRAMTILSGCDYLPSIPGIGLKTACNLLKKWKTAEAVIRAISIEGKKAVPVGYLEQFRLAEKCFLHQRVYCPKREKLVHLTDIGPDWNDKFDAYVGGDVDPTLAKSIALGNNDPATYLPIKDINLNYLPHALKPLHTDTNNVSIPGKGKAKARQSMPTPVKSTGGILSFFGPNPIIPAALTKQKNSSIPTKQLVAAGKASGKRTLSEVMDQDMAQKKKHRYSHSPLKLAQSRFSAHGDVKSEIVRRRHSDGVIPMSGRSRAQADKENVDVCAEEGGDTFLEDSELEQDASELSLRAQIDDSNSDDRRNFNIEDFPDAVEQEDGYISPSPSCSKDVQDLSSPPGPSRQRVVSMTGVIASDDEDDADTSFGADVVSSPVSVKKLKSRSRFHSREASSPWIAKSKSKSKSAGGSQVFVLVASTPSPKGKEHLIPDVDESDVQSPTLFRGPDLRNLLGGDDETVLEFSDKPKSTAGSASPPSSYPETPNNIDQQVPQFIEIVDVDNLEDVDEYTRRQEETVAQSQAAVMAGWRQRWARPSTGSKPPVKGQTQHTSALRYPISLASNSKHKAQVSIPSSSRTISSGTFNLRRSDTNVTPAGRHSLSEHKPPRSAPSKLFNTSSNNINNGSMDPPNIKHLSVGKPRRNHLLFESVKGVGIANGSTSESASFAKKPSQSVDLTLDDDSDDIEELDSATLTDMMVKTSARARLSQFRCS